MCSKPLPLFFLQTATETARLEGHKGPVAAVAFSPSGKIIASYSLVQGEVKIWSVTQSFFGFGSTPHCVQTIPVDRTRVSSQQLLEQLQLKWQGETAVVVDRAWVGTVILAVKKLA